MNVPQEHHGEHERKEGLGGRVRRFVDTELSRVRDKENRRPAEAHTDHPVDSDPGTREGAADSSGPARVDPAHDSGPAQDTQRAHNPDQVRYSEPPAPAPDAAPDAGGPGYVDRPVTAAPHDAGREPPPPARSEDFRGQSGDQHAAEGSAARVGLLNDVAELRDEWQRVQSTFVDDPPRAVHEASMLIDRTLDEIRANVGSKHPSEATSTEDLRVSFQRYREFFQRLLSA